MSAKESKPVYLQVIEYISGQVEQGILKKGDKLPTERSLVEILGVGRNSIREALKVLEIIGIVERRQGAGTYIKADFSDWFTKPMCFAFMLSETKKKEIFQFRNMIEVEIATLAAVRITKDELTELEDCYRQLIETEDQGASAKHDKNFHSILAKASKNIVIINAYNAMDCMLDLFIYDIRSQAYTDAGKELSVKIHREILDAIVERDAKRARQAMKQHMDVVRRYYN